MLTCDHPPVCAVRQPTSPCFSCLEDLGLGLSPQKLFTSVSKHKGLTQKKNLLQWWRYSS